MSGKVCPQCGTRYEGEQRFCSLDGATLIAEQQGDSLTGIVLADRYLVRDKLGEGGMGEVYLAEHVRMKRKVAVKVMRKWLTTDAAAIGRFHREAENASQISHPNVAAVYDFGETSDGLVYLAMEFVAGESLTKVLERESALNHVRASDIVSQISEALAAAHALGILHRDLKPDNVMIGKTRVGTDQVKLLDFGIARVMGRETQHFTSTGLIIGTPDWMSPEQISGDHLDARADIYALGLIAFRMLAGEGAFGGGSSQDTLLAKMTKPPRRLAEARPEIVWPEALQNTLDKALASDAQERYADAVTFAHDFYYAAQELPLTPEAEQYLLSLSRRGVTPSRGTGSLEPTSGISDRFVTPPTGTASIASADTEVSRRTPVSEDTTEAMPIAAYVDTAAAVAAADTVESTPIYGGAATPPPARRRGPILAGAVVGAVVLVVAVAIFSKGGSGTVQPNALTDSSALVAGTAAGSSLVAPPPSGVASTDGAASLDTARRRSERSVFRVINGAGQSAAAFLADSQGLVLTSTPSAFGKAGDTVSVLIDGSKRLLARVVATERSGLLALRIPMLRCDKCVPVPMAAGDADAAPGDSLVAIGGPALSGQRLSTKMALASRDSATGRLVGSARVAAAAFGGPVLLRNGAALGVVKSSGASGTVLTPISAVKRFLSDALAAFAKVAPVDSQPPTWGPRPVSVDVWNEGRRRVRAEVERTFLVVDRDFAVLLMTPQVVAWRDHLQDSLKKTVNLNSTEFCPLQGKCDPIEEWSPWRDYVSERRNVLIVQVSPREAAPPNLGHRPQLIQFRKGSIESFLLKRDDKALDPIEARRIHAVANPDAYAPDQQFWAGVYVFSPSDVIGAQSLQIVVWDRANGNRSITIALRKPQIDAITADLIAAGAVAR